MDEPTQFAKQPRTIIAAVVLVLAVIAGSWALFGRGGDQSATPKPTQRATSSSPASPQSSSQAPSGVTAYASACGLRGGAVDAPTGPIANTSWVSDNGWSLPVTKQQGPGRRTANGPWSCYAQTPSGAVLAAYTIAMRIDGVASDWQAVVKQQTVPGVGQNSRLNSGRNVPENGVVTPKGFVLDSYSATNATVTYYLTTGDGSAASCSINVVWSGGTAGDWQLQLQPDGTTISGCVQGVPTRYVKWGPTS